MEGSITTNQLVKITKQIDSLGRIYATGRRKESVARVWIRHGVGEFSINKHDKLLDYFKRESLCQIIKMPFILTSTLDKYDVFSTIKGGGLSGQAGALSHGISRALSKVNLELHSILRKNGLLTRDSRVVERKKYGKHKARKSCQYSKR